jgi:hypothetical protein
MLQNTVIVRALQNGLSLEAPGRLPTEYDFEQAMHRLTAFLSAGYEIKYI